MTLLTTRIPSPVGELTLIADGDVLTMMQFEGDKSALATAEICRQDDAWFNPISQQLDSYFAGELQDFSIPLRPAGTEFQRKVWDQLLLIPYGETLGYGELARRLNNPGASRAVGLANNKNPITIIIPCHRVIGADGSLTGYGGGMDRKRFLLDLEMPEENRPNTLF